MADGTTTELIPSVAIDRVLAAREKAKVALHQVLDLAHGIDKLFRDAGVGIDADGDLIPGFCPELFSRAVDQAVSHNYASIETGRSSRFEEEVLRTIDALLWRDVLHRSGMRSHLSATLREQWNNACHNRKTVPFEYEALVGTFGDYLERRDEIFQDAIVEIFRKLSWDYKTNQPSAFTKRFYLRYMRADALDDLDRAMHRFDGKPEPDHRVSFGHRFYWRCDAKTEEGEYLIVTLYKKGSAKVQFKRLDLMDKLNGILAKRYPRALPEARAGG